ncbi:MAG: EamA family transporter [Clostridiales bacterium]|nr:EamA family transporter [Clostridiales bacterium]
MSTLFYSGVLVFGVFISSISQILLKKSANKKHGSFIKEYLNPIVIVSYMIFFCATFMSIYAYKGIPLSMGPVLDSSGYIFVTVLSAIFLKEKPTPKKVIALLIIITGIVIYSFN